MIIFTNFMRKISNWLCIVFLVLHIYTLQAIHCNSVTFYCNNRLLIDLKMRSITDLYLAIARAGDIHSLCCRMKELEIEPDGNEVTFAQLLGMRDHITYPLGE